jgi:hypothetical protein
VVILTEGEFPLTGRCQRWILERLAAVPVDRAHQQRSSSRSQHTEQLGDRTAIVRNVLEDVTAQDEVEALIVEGQIRDVGLGHRERGVEVRADVIDIRKRAEVLLKEAFRREVQQPETAAADVELVLKVEPEKPMPFPGATPKATGVRTAGAVDRIGPQEPPKPASAAWTLD